MYKFWINRGSRYFKIHNTSITKKKIYSLKYKTIVFYDKPLSSR